MKISFSVPGTPIAQERVIPKKGGKPFMPKQSRDYQKRIWAEFARAHPRCPTHHGPVIVRFSAIFPITAGWPPAIKAAAERGTLFHIATPDKENIEKLLLDALSPTPDRSGLRLGPETKGHPWRNDSQCMGGGMKRYGTNPRLDVTLEFIDQPDGLITPAQARHEERAITEQVNRRLGLTGRTPKALKAQSAKGAKGAQTPLERAIAAADARDAQKGLK